MVGGIFDAMDVFLGGVGVSLGLGRGGDYQHHAGVGNGANQRNWIAESTGSDEEQHHGAVLLGRVAADGGEQEAIGIAGSAGLMALLQALLTGKMPGFDPPRLVPWSAALAMGTLVLSGIAGLLLWAEQSVQEWRRGRIEGPLSAVRLSCNVAVEIVTAVE